MVQTIISKFCLILFLIMNIYLFVKKLNLNIRLKMYSLKRFIQINLDLASIYNSKKLKSLNFYTAMGIYTSKIMKDIVILIIAIDMLMEYYLLVKKIPLILSTKIIQISL